MNILIKEIDNMIEYHEGQVKLHTKQLEALRMVRQGYNAMIANTDVLGVTGVNSGPSQLGLPSLDDALEDVSQEEGSQEGGAAPAKRKTSSGWKCVPKVAKGVTMNSSVLAMLSGGQKYKGYTVDEIEARLKTTYSPRVRRHTILTTLCKLKADKKVEQVVERVRNTYGEFTEVKRWRLYSPKVSEIGDSKGGGSLSFGLSVKGGSHS